MKKLYILLVALFVLNGAMAQWFPQNSGTAKNLNSVYFTDVNTGYAVGDSGIILKTIDGGANWTSQTSGTYYNLRSVHFPVVDTGFVVGGSGWFGFIMKTVNGGDTWSIVYTSDTIIGGSDCGFNSVYFTDINTGYAVGGFSDIVGTLHPLMRKTSDAGISWQSQSTGMETFLNSVCFTASNIGYVVGNDINGGIIFKTTNGGADWTLQNTDTAYSLGSVYFTNADTGYAVGNMSNYWNGGNSIILKTINGGINWSASVLGQIDGLQLNSIFFPSENTGYAVGTCCFEGIKTVYNTTDGGLNWTFEDYSLGGLNSVYFPSVDTGYTVGIDGIILKTTNGGVGINDQHQTTNTLNIYPNPVADKITIETPVKGSLSVLNLGGQQLLQKEITEPTTKVDVSGLKSGVYFVRLTGERTVKVVKIVKN